MGGAKITATKLTEGSANPGTSQLSASITPKSHRLIIAVYAQGEQSGAAENPTLTGCGITWNKLTYVNPYSNQNRLTIWYGIGKGETGQLQWTFGGGEQDQGFWAVIELDNTELGNDGVSAIIQTIVDHATSADVEDLVLNASAFQSQHNATIMFLALPDAPTPPSGYTQIAATGQDYFGGGPDLSLWTYFKDTPDQNDTVVWSGSGAGVAIGVKMEIKYAPAGGALLADLI